MDPSEDAAAPPDRPKGRGGRRARPRGPSPPAPKRSLNLSIPPEDYERLAVHALRGGQTISDLVCSLARLHLREFHISRTGGRAGGEPDAA